MSSETYLIGKAASLADVSIDAIRYYEKLGLVTSPRRESGYREFDRETVSRLRFIKRAQSLGFSLKEIDELLFLASDEDATCEEIRSMAEVKLTGIQQKIDKLKRLQDVLLVLVQACAKDEPVTQCPILESLADDMEWLQ